MLRHGSSGNRGRIPAAIAATSAATIQRAMDLLHEAGRIIHLPGLFGTRNVGRGDRPHSSKPGTRRLEPDTGGSAPSSRDDTH